MNNSDYGAISIDTSIFDANGLRIESGLFKKLEQFKPTDIDIVLSDIVFQEVESHLKKKIAETHSSIEKCLRNSESQLAISEHDIAGVKELLLAMTVDETTSSRLKSFVENTGLIIIESEQYLNVKSLIESYFNAQPPFTPTGNKKAEFPDAIALMTLEAWAKDYETKVFAVTNDSDWLKYSETSDWIDCTNNFAEALAAFQPHTAPYEFFEALAGDIDRKDDSEFYNLVEQSASSLVESLYVDADASSGFFWEPEEDVQMEFSSIEFQYQGDKPHLQLVEVDIDSEMVVVQAVVDIDAKASCVFSLSVHDSIDKDYVYLGSSSATTEVSFESEVLLTFVGNFSDIENFTGVDLADIEFLSTPSDVNFGDLEPDFWGE
ncbi:PIN domain-containing protein [Vibrio vulnificus]|uniref:PIN domain-containing protein n=1 Tax=Vibrio vulnificus TaxID=672 RepID=UPI0032EFE747